MNLRRIPAGAIAPDNIRTGMRTPRRRAVGSLLTRPTASMVHDPAFVYTTGQVGGAAIAASNSAQASVSIQAAEDFLCSSIAADFDQSDWTFRMVMGGMSANLFNQDIRGALLFGPAAGAGVNNWPWGWQLNPAMLIPSNTTVTFHVTNGATGALNIFFALNGNRLTS